MSQEKNNQPAPEIPAAPVELLRQTRPASEWCQQVEQGLAELSSRRHELRQQLAAQQAERRAGNPRAEQNLSVRQAHQLAKARVLGEDWQRADLARKQAGLRFRSVRRQLARVRTEQGLARQRSAGWSYWVLHAPRQLWKTHTLKKTLRQANDQRRQAIKVLRVLRPTATVPEVRARILELTESLLVNDERLKHSIQSLHQTDQSVSAGISQALRLAPQLRALGERPIAMEQPVDPAVRKFSIPNPVGALVPDTPVPARQCRVRLA